MGSWEVDWLWACGPHVPRRGVPRRYRTPCARSWGCTGAISPLFTYPHSPLPLPTPTPPFPSAPFVHWTELTCSGVVAPGTALPYLYQVGDSRRKNLTGVGLSCAFLGRQGTFDPATYPAVPTYCALPEVKGMGWVELFSNHTETVLMRGFALFQSR